MTTSRRHIKDTLNISAQITRKYNLGNKEHFFIKFKNFDKSLLEAAWTVALKKIQSREIIKDASNLSTIENQKANERALEYENNFETLLKYLNSKFDLKQLKLLDENIERRVRHLLADRYKNISVSKVDQQIAKSKNRCQYKAFSFLEKHVAIFMLLAILGVFVTPRVISGLTPVQTLAIGIHDRSSYKYRIGATCRDGWNSDATRRGACSHHGGVAKWIYQTAYNKTMDECIKEAKVISWLE